jgi:type VI secretion system protein ImpL
MLACAAGLCFLLAACFFVSWLGNRSLEARAVEAARGISTGESTGVDLASVDALQRLDTLRQTIVQLGDYEREGAPLHLRWGLYAGSDVYVEARRVYFDRFRQLLFAQTQASMLGGLRNLPVTPGPEDQYGPAYDTLKAYLITSSHHDHSTRPFLAPVLMRHWAAGRTIDPQRNQLADAVRVLQRRAQRSDPFGSRTTALPSSAVDGTWASLPAWSVYQNMLADASRGNPSLQFNRRFPGSAEVVIDTHEVSGAFSKGGWTFMKDALRHADKYFSGEQWVLGDQTAANFDRGKLEQQLRDRYVADFIAQWRAYIKAAAVVRYTGIPDASKKLTLLAGNQSPLLALFWLASQNTAVDSLNRCRLPTHTDRGAARQRGPLHRAAQPKLYERPHRAANVAGTDRLTTRAARRRSRRAGAGQRLDREIGGAPDRAGVSSGSRCQGR